MVQTRSEVHGLEICTLLDLHAAPVTCLSLPDFPIHCYVDMILNYMNNALTFSAVRLDGVY